jgi:hypothetical protein
MNREITIEDDPEQTRLLRDLVEGQRHTNHILREILHARHPDKIYGQTLLLFTTGDIDMASPITTLPLGGQAQLVCLLTQNGSAVTPQPASYVPVITSSDTNVTSAPATVDVSGGVALLTSQFILTDAAGDALGAIDAITSTATAPDGTPLTETVNITIGPSTVTSTFGQSMTLYPVGVTTASARR